jgi:hypothetical protein
MRYVATVKGGMHANYSSDISSIKAIWNDFHSTRAVQALSKKGSYALRELVDALIPTAVPGGTVRFRMNQISASPELGGKRPIDDVFLIDRPTTAADLVLVKAALTEHSELTHTVEQAANADRNPLGTR